MRSNPVASGVASFIRSRLPTITVRRLLKSCASPPVICPTTSIFCAWYSAFWAWASLGLARRQLAGPRDHQLLEMLPVMHELDGRRGALGDVEGHAEQADRRAVGAEQRAAATMDHPHDAVGSDDTAFGVVVRTARQRVLDRRAQATAIIRMNGRDQHRVAQRRIVAGSPKSRLAQVGAGHAPARQLDLPGAEAAGLERQPDALPILANHRLGALPHDRGRQHIGGRLQERDVVLGELAVMRAVDLEHAERAGFAADDHVDRPGHAVLDQERRKSKPRLPFDMLRHHRLAGFQRIAGR